MVRDATLLIVPGYKGSGPDHWQSWLEQQVPGATRVVGIDWNAPILAQWAGRVRDTLARTTQPIRVVAHSFGCLAAVVAAADRPECVADLVLVAPADPARFDFVGLRPESSHAKPLSLCDALPLRDLGVNGCLVASRNDTWLEFGKARELAGAWGLGFHDAGAKGHINEEAGFGAWPEFVQLLAQRGVPRHDRPRAAVLGKGRGSALAAVRQLTRAQIDARTFHADDQR
ncbi:MAG TPA: alpha/beta hydrolase [Pseudomonadales bacterium]